MWKDWLAFSRREQYGIVFLAVLVVLFLGVRLMLPRLTGPGQPDFRVRSSLVLSEEEDSPEQTEVREQEPKEKKEKLPAFDPNNVSVTRLDEMGVAPYAIVNWIKYREAGGSFKEPGDIRKVYGLDSALTVRLEASAYFPSSGQNEAETYARTESRLDGPDTTEKDRGKTDAEASSGRDGFSTGRTGQPESSKEINIEINKAGSGDFQKLTGIGKVYSERIVAFREALGGFYSVEQLSEVYGISRELFESIKSQVTINSEPYRKISVNQASVRRLKKHPYIDFYQARDIIEYRKENGEILKGEVLRSFSSFSAEQLERILPYLSFVSQNEGNLTKN
ncbi:MAG: helix-hairpin-helix domain-containing protein [Bacteroidota bacterium]